MWRARQRDRLPDELRQLEFVETVEELAAMHNLEVPLKQAAAPARSSAISGKRFISDGRSEYVLPTIFTATCCHVSRQYLEKRGLSHEVIARFAIVLPPLAGTTS